MKDYLTISKAFSNGKIFEKRRILKMLTKDKNYKGIPMKNHLDTIKKIKKELGLSEEIKE